MFESILSAIAAPFIAIAALFTPAPQVVEVPDLNTQAEIIDLQRTIDQLQRQLDNVSEYASGSYTYTDEKYGVLLGATNDIPTPVALFEDSLRSSITTTDTSFTLVSGTDVTGTSLASSTYGFIIDEGQANEEFVLADCTGTTCTNAVRGVSPVTGTSSVTALKKSHRRGASVKITDAPLIPILTGLVNGDTNLPNILKYKTDRATTTFTSAEDIVNKGYVDSVAFSGAGAVAATESAIGYAELATQAEMAAGTQNGSVGPLVLQSQYATATAPGSGNYVPVTGSNGLIDHSFLTLAMPTGSVIPYATTSAPTGWLLADGSSVATSTYPNLFAVIGYSYGGSGASFNLPDLSGRNVIGFGSATTTFDEMGETGGADEHTLTIAEMPAHDHDITTAGQSSGDSHGSGQTPTGDDGSPSGTGNDTTAVQSQGGGNAHNIMDPFIVLQYIIKT